MNTKSKQAERTEQATVEREFGRTRSTRQYAGRAAMAIVTVGVGAALTVLVIGVTGGTDTNPPPSPGVEPSQVNELTPDFIDPTLRRLAQERAALPPGFVDPQLDRLANERTTVPPAFIDPQLRTLAAQRAAEQD